MPSTGLNGRPILILDEKEAGAILMALRLFNDLVPMPPDSAILNLKTKIDKFVTEAASTATQPTFVELMTQRNPDDRELPRPTGEDRPAGCFGPATPVVDPAEPRRYV